MQPWYPFFWADWSNKTGHLTMAQNGAYILLLRYIYAFGKPIPHKHRYSIAKAMLEQECSDVDAVLDQFFKRKGDNWHSSKAEEVIAEANARHQAYVDAGKKGGKRRYSQAGSDAQAGLKPSPSNYNHNQKEKSGVKPRAFEGAASLPLKGVDPSWNGTQASIVAIVGERDFMAYLAEARFNPGPPAVIEVATPARASLLLSKFGSKLRDRFPVEIAVVREAAE